MIIDIISDLHGAKPKLDGGDLLILGGDYTRADTLGQYLAFREWLRAQEYKKKIMIGGNHDMAIFDGRFYFNDDWLGATWLNDSGCEYEGLKFWGSPWTSWFEGINPLCTAWTLGSEKELAEKWALIPDETDILITHSPPYGIMDEVAQSDGSWKNVGSKSLTARIHAIPVLQHTKPFIHIFGHVHEGHGYTSHKMMQFINASIMDINYVPSNKPVRIEL